MFGFILQIPDYFVLIDEYKDLPKTFFLEAVMSAGNNMGEICGYRIYKKPTKNSESAIS